jgi:hypothetical protein
MGNEAVCTLRYNGKSFAGKALLETSELLFRGDTRLKLPFSTITAVHSKDGELHVRTKDGRAVFVLGLQAEKWHNKIANPKSLLDKLGVKSGESVTLIGAFSSEFLADLKKRNATIHKNKPAKDSPWIFLQAASQEALKRVPAIAKTVRGATALWVVYPKGQKSITASDVRSTGLKAGLVDIKVASFSPTHTALKFVLPKSKR